MTNLTFANTPIHCENSVVLLGIEIYHSLTFNTHIANICKKAARQLASGLTTSRSSPYSTRETYNFQIIHNIKLPTTVLWSGIFVANLAPKNLKKFRREHFNLFTMIIHPFKDR